MPVRRRAVAGSVFCVCVVDAGKPQAACWHMHACLLCRCLLLVPCIHPNPHPLAPPAPARAPLSAPAPNRTHTNAALMPTILVGPLVGVAVVYGLEKGDLFAIRRKFWGTPKRKKAPPRVAVAATN